MAEDKKRGGPGKSLSDELLDDDFFKPPVEAETPADEDSGKPAKVPMTPPGGPTRPRPRPAHRRSVVPLIVAIVVLLAAIGVVGYLYVWPQFQPQTQHSTAPKTPKRPVLPSGSAEAAPETETGSEGEQAEGQEAGKKEIKDFYKIDLGPYVKDSPEAKKVEDTLNTYGFKSKVTENVREWETYRLYLNRAYDTQEEAQNAGLDVKGFGFEPQLQPLRNGKFTLLLGEFDDKAKMEKLAGALEENTEHTTMFNSQKEQEVSLAWTLDSEWTYRPDALETMRILEEGGLKPRLEVIQREVE